jgi:hypothetical protein
MLANDVTSENWKINKYIYNHWMRPLFSHQQSYTSFFFLIFFFFKLACLLHKGRKKKTKAKQKQSYTLECNADSRLTKQV